MEPYPLTPEAFRRRLARAIVNDPALEITLLDELKPEKQMEERLKKMKQEVKELENRVRELQKAKK